MKRNGFSLAELLATIVILSVIILIAVPSYLGVTKSVKEKNYQNKKDYLTTKALEYANDNNIDNKTITVNTLLVEGYIASDGDSTNEYENIVNPNGGYFDCDLIDIRKDGDIYSVEITETNNCDMVKIEEASEKIKIYVYDENDLDTELGINNVVNWTSNNVLLFVDVSKLELKDNTITYDVGGSTIVKNKNIASSVKENINNSSNILKVDSLIFLDTTYQVTVNTEEGLITQNVRVRIDKESPYVNVTVSNEWTNNNKEVQILGSDGNGSGVDKYYYVSSDTLPTRVPSRDDFNITSSSIMLGAGVYYFYAIDKVGNISTTPLKVDIANIDVDAPVCKLPADSANWTKGSVTITYGCESDTKSGCKTEDMTKTFTQTTGYYDLTWNIKDNLDNETTCQKRVNVKLDNTPPTYVFNETNSKGLHEGKYIDYVNVTVSCRDGESGIASGSQTKTFQGRGTYTISGTCKDNVGNTTNYSKTYTIVEWGTDGSKCGTYQCNPHNCNPYSCNPHNCNPHNCNPYSCNPYNCNPYSCNCWDYCAEEGWVGGGFIDAGCHSDPVIGCPCCTGSSIPNCWVYGESCGGYSQTWSCIRYERGCNTCWNTCYNTCWNTCYDTCYDTCYNTCYDTCSYSCYY